MGRTSYRARRLSSVEFNARSRRVYRFDLLLIMGPFLLVGCRESSDLGLQRYEPSQAAANAMDSYDKNTDGKLSVDELRGSPALAASVRRLDRNRDNLLAADEIQSRFEELEKQLKYASLELTVTSRGQPLVGANVTLTPEPFTGPDFPVWAGTTIEGGLCPLGTERGDLLGVPIGFYTVKIAHPAQNLDAMRGVEIARDTTGSRLEIAL